MGYHSVDVELDLEWRVLRVHMTKKHVYDQSIWVHSNGAHDSQLFQIILCLNLLLYRSS